MSTRIRRPMLASWLAIALAAGEAPIMLAFLCGQRVVEVVTLDEAEAEHEG